jgi:hypothetical protein
MHIIYFDLIKYIIHNDKSTIYGFKDFVDSVPGCKYEYGRFNGGFNGQYRAKVMFKNQEDVTAFALMFSEYIENV